MLEAVEPMKRLILFPALLVFLLLGVRVLSGRSAKDGLNQNDRAGIGGNSLHMLGGYQAAGALVSNNRVFYATAYAGANAGTKIQEALNAACANGGKLPSTNGVVDARGLTGAQSIPTTITMPQNCTLLLGSGTFYERNGAEILYDSGDSIIGTSAVGNKTTDIEQSPNSRAAIAYVHGSNGSGAYNILIEGLHIGGFPRVATMDMNHTISSVVRNISLWSGTSAPALLTGDSGCDCYNKFYNVGFFSAKGYGAKLDAGANQNSFFSCAFGTGPTGLAGLYIGGAPEILINPNFEHLPLGIEIAGFGSNTVIGAYFEADAENVKFDAGTVGNVILGGDLNGGVLDNSGNTTNDVSAYGSAHAPGFQQYPTLTGVSMAGLTSLAELPTPAAPTATVVGRKGTTSYGPYYVVCHDRNGGVTLPSSASNVVTNGPATLSPRNHVQIHWPYSGYGAGGCWSWDVLKGNTATVLATRIKRPTLDNLLYYDDTGQPTSAYTAPTRNSTGDENVAGNLSVGGLVNLPTYTFAKLPKESNGSLLYCSDCKSAADDGAAFDSPAAPGGHGAMLLGENGRWRNH